ncbi:hypothetical protein F2P79_005671 [Pimephales promelas]|nr:hypothetical protein F2P79_005671 [Pimephales promelas]
MGCVAYDPCGTIVRILLSPICVSTVKAKLELSGSNTAQDTAESLSESYQLVSPPSRLHTGSPYTARGSPKRQLQFYRYCTSALHV